MVGKKELHDLFVFRFPLLCSRAFTAFLHISLEPLDYTLKSITLADSFLTAPLDYSPMLDEQMSANETLEDNMT